VKGTAQLNATMDLSGKISLTGTYTISEGAYELSLSGIVRRKFNIKEGSAITWTGEPTSANVDITAVYKLETSALELFESQMASSAETTDKNRYKQKLPFEVNLFIKNELMHPQISFGLDMPENERNKYAISSNVYNRIKQINADESELNKQVLGLLVMNRFVASNPFSSLESSGSGMEGIARQSASKLLSQELNNLAGDLIQGVDLNFDLASEEDYSSGKLENRTDLNVGVSKELLGGRTTVYVGSNFELEGEEISNRKTTNIAGDVSIEYKLPRDGRYRLRAYRKDEYESIVEGQVVETGLSFILTMDYNKFRELFHRKANPDKKKKNKTGIKKNDSIK
jgi:translocation and assembly module TamB